MNIDEMTDQEKSVMLLCLTGHKYVKGPKGGWFNSENELVNIEFVRDTNIYHPGFLDLAWRTRQWCLSHIIIGPPLDSWLWVEGIGYDLPNLDAAAAQRAWLDKILELAVEAGIIEPA
jgi:hypothetical protein